MATLSQQTFLRENRDLLRSPALVVGSRMYDYDDADLRVALTDLGVESVFGIDIVDGPGVDQVVDICDADAFVDQRRGSFATILCMEMITHVPQPFVLGSAVSDLLEPGGTLFLSECAVRKLSRMPADHWRFTYTGMQLLFPSLVFDDARTRMSLPRDHGGTLLPYRDHLPEVLIDQRHPDETALGFQVRRLHRRFLAKGVFGLSRLMPESSIASVARKPS